jgi:NosR/NirI family nitrous oxide reductase transcriptional regulator
MSCANTSPSPPPETDAKRRLRRYALGVYRLGIVFAAFALVRGGDRAAQDDPAPLLAIAREEVPATTELGEPVDGLFPLLDKNQNPVGWAARTHPAARPINGYAGPSELAVIFGTDHRVRAVRMIQTADTSGHVAKVLADQEYWQQWHGQAEARLGALESPKIVSGATLTSEAMARGVAARFGAAGMADFFGQPLEPARVQRWFPSADRLAESRGHYTVFHANRPLGQVLRSSRMGVAARGYNGAPDVIVALDPAGERVLGVGMLVSRDNEPYTGDVRDELKFADGFAGRSVAEILAAPADDGLIVSGASMTAAAVIDNVREMLRRHTRENSRAGIPWPMLLGFSWIALGIAFGFSKRLSNRRTRFVMATLSVAAGLTLGWMIGQDQLIGWARHGFDAGVALPWLVLAAVAMVVPALTGKNIYCGYLCPHGAAQRLAGSVLQKRFALSGKIHRTLQLLPWLTLLAIWALAFAALNLPFSQAEPFEVWSSGFYALIPAAIFTLGMLAAVVLPQAYCHYGCPTGALLKFLTHAPGRWTRRDSLAGLLILLATIYVAFV